MTDIKTHELNAIVESLHNEEGMKIEELNTFSSLLERTDYGSIEKALFESYPDEAKFKAEYEGFYKELTETEPLIGKPVIIYLEEQTIESEESDVDEIDCGYVYSEIKGIDPETGYELDLEFFAWNEWLAFRIFEQDVDIAGAAGYLAHCFYKMTINGYKREDIEMNLEQKKLKDDPIKETSAFLPFLSGTNVEVEDRPAIRSDTVPEPPNDGMIAAEKGLFGKLIDLLKGRK